MLQRLRAFFWQDFEKAFGRELTPVEKWSLKNANKATPEGIVLVNNAKDVRFQFSTNSYGEFREDMGYVNGVKMPADAANAIYASYDRLKNERERMAAAERRAIADMERNEVAWNLVEKLLGMRRNEHGALVPVEVP